MKGIIQYFPKESARRREILDDLMDYLTGLFSPVISPIVINQIAGILENSFSKGNRRVMNLNGEDIETPILVPSKYLQPSIIAQVTYIKNLNQTALKLINKIIQQALDEGLSIPSTAKLITSKISDMTTARATLIARTEIIKASALGTQSALKAAGVKEVVWIATNDKKTCPICRDLNRSVWSVDNVPIPGRDSHPRCRCSLGAVVTS